MKFKINDNLFKVTYEGKERYVITDDSKIKPSNKFLADGKFIVTCNNNVSESFINGNFYRSKSNKIIASTFPLGNLPQFIIEYEFTEEDLRKVIDLARTGYGWEGNINVVDHLDNDGYGGCIDNFNKEFKFKIEEEIIQSLQKSKEITEIEFEIEINQCDGCMSNYPIINGVHQIPYPSGKMVCKANLYNNLKITKSNEYPQGLLTIKNVKYE